MSETALATNNSGWSIPEDMREEMAGLPETITYYSFNGNSGRYHDRSIKKADGTHDDNPELHKVKLTGIILSYIPGQSWLRKENEKWSQKWICRGPNKKQAPIVNHELDEAERAEIARMGAGRSCLTCPLSKFLDLPNGERRKPVCGSYGKLLLLTDDNTVCFLTIGGTSSQALEKWLAATFRQPKAMLPFYAKVVTFGHQHASGNGKSWKVATFAVDRDVAQEEEAALVALRAQYLSQFQSTEPEQQHEEEAAAPQSSPTAPPQQSAQPTGQGTFMGISEDGEPIWGDINE